MINIPGEHTLDLRRTRPRSEDEVTGILRSVVDERNGAARQAVGTVADAGRAVRDGGSRHFEVVEQISVDDVVASRIHITGTHLGDYMGMKASGQEVSFTGITYDRIVDGKLVEAWHEMNLWGTLLMVAD